MAMPAVALADRLARRHVQSGEQRGHAVALVAVGLPGGHPGCQRQNRLRAIQGLDLALFVHAKHHGVIRRIHVEANDVTHLLHKLGSLENLRFSTRCGCRPKACQMRTTAVCDSPVLCAIRRLLQCVLLSGIASRVCVTTASTCSSVIERGAPGRGSSSNPSSRFTRNRSRHLQPVAPVMCSRFATSPLLIPSAQPRTMRARMAIACADVGRRANMESFDFSSGVTLSGFVGRPMAIPEYAPGGALLQRISDS